jgi:hypothetical protein
MSSQAFIFTQMRRQRHPLSPALPTKCAWQGITMKMKASRMFCSRSSQRWLALAAGFVFIAEMKSALPNAVSHG